MMIGIQSKCCIYGGIHLYHGIIEHLNSRVASVHECDTPGYKILACGFEFLIKTLLKNAGKNVHEELAKIYRGESQADVIENVKVFGNMMSSAVITGINLLMCDEIIKAGKSIKQDKIENQ